MYSRSGRRSSWRSGEDLLCFLLLYVARIAAFGSFRTFRPLESSGYKSSYDRYSDVQQQCAPYLADFPPHPSPLPSDSKWAISHELRFVNGGWQQAADIAPLMPFMPLLSDSSSAFITQDAEHLASLWITDVELRDGAFSSLVNVSAVLQLGVSSQGTLSYRSTDTSGFQIYPGFSLLTIRLEGVYAERHESETRLLCLVGSSKLPSRGKNASVPWDWLDSDTLHPPTSDDSKILAVFYFPKVLSLTSRDISGSLTSFHSPADPQYFNRVDFFSQLDAHSRYSFLSGDLVTSACVKTQGFPGELPRPQKFYQGNAFCSLFQNLVTAQMLDILPNWNCSLSKEICQKLGPFSKDSAAQFMDGGFKGTQLLIQDVRCVDYLQKDGSPAANVSVVFRVVLPSQNQYLARLLSGLDGLTLAADGKWSNFSGQLCMIGCRGHGASTVEAGKNRACNAKICIYIPLELSLKQRSLLQGRISSTHNNSEYFYPLSFHLLHPPVFPATVAGKVTYEYTKIIEAGALLEKFESIGFGERIKKSLLKFPFAKGNLMALFEDLSFHSLAITTPNPSKGSHLNQYVDFDILAIDERVGLDWMQLSNISASAPPSAVDDEVEKVREQKNLYKIAAEFRITDNSGTKLSAVSSEGEYDPAVGRMFLIGCREVNAPWKTFHENAELLDDGMDCLIELTIEYPATNARWLINPTVMLSVTSKRTEDDPLFFATMKLQTYPILYKSQREQIVSRKSLEGGLSILTLSLILGCILSQLIYIRSQADSTPYISLLMLAVQAVGFSIPLITGMEAFFAKASSNVENRKEAVLSDGRWTSVLSKVGWTWAIGYGYIVKLLTLAAFMLTLRIVQKVLKSRVRLGTRRPLEPWRVPSDKRVLAICCAIHVFGFVTVLIIHWIRISQSSANSSTFMDWSGSLHKKQDWERVLNEYYGLVQDLFLLPQVVGNHLWEVKGKPLRIFFYCGVTVLRLLPHIYDSLRPLDFNPYLADEFQYANPSSDFYSKVGDIAIPVVAVLLAVVVYIQQRWNGLKWAKVLQEGSFKLTQMGTKMYDRLPSKTFEAEMVESVSVKRIPENAHNVFSSDH